MTGLALRIWKDDEGALLSTEWVFLATILVIGTTTGLVAVRNGVNSELTEFANATTQLNQCYGFTGQSSCAAYTCGSSAADVPDVQTLTNTPATTPGGNSINVGPCGEEGLAPGAGGTPSAIQGASGTRTAPGVLPASGTRRPECTDVEPGASNTGTPAGFQRNKDDCTDQNTGKQPAPIEVTPAAGQRDKGTNK